MSQEPTRADPDQAGDRPIRPVTVVTDSTTYVPGELLDSEGIRRVNLYVSWDGETRPEGDFEDLDLFYRRLRESPTLPTTSQPSIGDFEACYEPLLKAGHDVVSVHIASGLSGTCESAQSAARALADRGHRGVVEVIDGATGAGGLGCLVLVAAAAARRGAGVEAVAEEVERARRELDIWFCLDTLEYLRRGGRIGAARSLLGTALSIKPILTFGTEITPVGRVRTRSKALERMRSYLVELHDRGASAWVVQHAQCPEDAERLVEHGTEIFGAPPLFCTQVGPVLGAHLGSGMLVGGLSSPLLDR